MIPYGKHYIDETDIQAVVEVLKSGTLTQGRYVEAFEQAVAEYVGAKYAVAVSSGTAALHLAALAAGVGAGDAVATTPITFVASANAGRYVGADVVFADIDPDTINMSVESLRQLVARTPAVRAIIPVHFAGLPCQMSAIKEIADQAGAVVIEDAAHALGASYPDGSRIGACRHSLMTIFSFHPVKAIAAGEGGMITTNDEHVYRKLIRLRSHGVNKLDDPLLLPEQAADTEGPYPWYYEMQELGFHYRITDIQSGLAASQMKHLDAFMAHRKALVDRYDRAFSSDALVRPAQVVDKSCSGNHIYPVRIDFAAIGKTRRQVMLALREREVGSQVHYIPVPMHPFYQRMGHVPSDYPEAMHYYSQALTLPLFFDLSFEQQDFVIQVLQEVLRT
jgi:perosamine synthetase